jgi:hypothetical protein
MKKKSKIQKRLHVKFEIAQVCSKKQTTPSPFMKQRGKIKLNKGLYIKFKTKNIYVSIHRCIIAHIFLIAHDQKSIVQLHNCTHIRSCTYMCNCI